MASHKFVITKWNERENGYYSVALRITKDRRNKYIRTGLSATTKQWSAEQGRYVCSSKVNKHYKAQNFKLNQLDIRAELVIKEFEDKLIDWTLNQFETAFLNRVSKEKVENYFNHLIATLRETGHIGNASCYCATRHILKLYDNKFGSRIFSEIDIKYVKGLDIFLQKRGCRGNTRKYYFKTLRACMNKAIQDGEAPQSTYPFGKGGFNIASLEEETPKRYLLNDSMTKLKDTVLTNEMRERTRRLFLFFYYCYGISFIDSALLTKKNIIRYNGGDYIVYKRAKTKEAKKVKPIQIKVTATISELLRWFRENTHLVGDYLVPIVSKDYKGEQLYSHIRNRFVRNNKNLKELAKSLDITDLKLTSYVSRHTMAMTLQDNQVPREVISQILGHSSLTTTNTYLDSFGSSVIDEAVRVL